MKRLMWIATMVACSGPSGTTTRGSAVETPASVTTDARPAADAAAPVTTAGILLGRVPGATAYGVIACASGPNTRQACEDSLVRIPLVGVQVQSRDGASARIARTATIIASDGKREAVELDRPVANVVTTAGSPPLVRRGAELADKDKSTIRTMVRKQSPKPRWASRESFAVTAYQADLDGDRTPDTIAVGIITDAGKDGSRQLIGLAVALAGKPFELVGFEVDTVEVAGTLDLDGDGRDEVLLERTGGVVDTRTYDYTLYRLLPGKRLALGMGQGGGSDAWQLYDALEDHPRDESDHAGE